MREWAVDDYGLLLTKEMIKAIASKVLDDLEERDEDEYGDALYEDGICEYIGEFTGEAIYIENDGAENWFRNGESYDGDRIYYVNVSKYPSLFKAAYQNMDELIAEFNSKVGDYLPEDFNYRANIRHIVGTYWG
jgi:hypothetical protein